MQLRKAICASVGVFALGLAVTAAGAASAQTETKRCFDKATLTYFDCPEETVAEAPAEPMMEEPSWTGFYIGAHGGYAWASMDGVYNGGAVAPDAALDLSDLDVDGFLAGGHIGYMHQFENNIVLGAEGDFSFVFADDTVSNAFTPTVANIPSTNSVEAELNWLASIRARAGYAAGEVMPYITGGVAFADYDVSARSTAGAAVTSGSIDQTAFGGVVGGGVEWMIDPNVMLRAEGLYYFFDDSESIAGLTAASDPGDNVGLDDVIAARVGISYKF